MRYFWISVIYLRVLLEAVGELLPEGRFPSAHLVHEGVCGHDLEVLLLHPGEVALGEEPWVRVAVLVVRYPLPQSQLEGLVPRQGGRGLTLGELLADDLAEVFTEVAVSKKY